MRLYGNIFRMANSFILEYLPQVSTIKFNVMSPQASPQVAPVFVWTFMYLVMKHVKGLFSNVVTFQVSSGSWNAEVCSEALNTFCELTDVFTQIEKSDQVT